MLYEIEIYKDVYTRCDVVAIPILYIFQVYKDVSTRCDVVVAQKDVNCTTADDIFMGRLS